MEQSHLERNQDDLQPTGGLVFTSEDLKDTQLQRYDECIATKHEKQLLSIFPEEIWLHLFQHVDNKTLENFSNSTLYFRSLLSPHRVLFLFPSVWKVLGTKYETDHNQVDVYNESKAAQDEDSSETLDKDNEDNNESPPSSAYSTPSRRSWALSSSSSSLSDISVNCPWFRGILNLRLVCATWRDGVDNFYQNMPNYYQMKHDAKENRGTKFKTWVMDYYNDYEPAQWAHVEFNGDFFRLEDFTYTFGNNAAGKLSNDNPFITRKFSLEYRDEDFYSYEQTRCLQRFGQHIWYCDVSCYELIFSRLKFYLTVQRELALIPNVKVLKFWYKKKSFLRQNFSYEEDCQMDQAINVAPLPKLEHVQFLKAKELPFAMLHELIRSNSHIAMLEIEGVQTYDTCDIFTTPLPNLKQLSLKFFSECDFVKLGNTQVDWLLTKLHLDFDDCDFIEWHKVFSLLERKWAATLTDVMISLPKTRLLNQSNLIMKRCASLRLGLPHVKRLKLIISNFSSLDFILPMKNSLQSLDITVRCNMKAWNKNKKAVAVQRGQTIQFLGYFGQNAELEQDSNIWNLFPKLKCVSVICRFDWDKGTGRCWCLGSEHVPTEIYRGEARRMRFY